MNSFDIILSTGKDKLSKWPSDGSLGDDQSGLLQCVIGCVYLSAPTSCAFVLV